MTIFRSEETLAGIITIAVVPWIVWTLRRGLREDRLPIGRGYVQRNERPSAFNSVFAFYVAAAFAMAFIGLDLLIGFTRG